MARAISDEELQLRKRARRRLIGAIVIVTAVVVALPMVLDNEPKPLTQDIDIRIPSPESAGPFTSKVVPVPESPSKPAVTAKPAPEAESKSPAQAKPAPVPSPQNTAKSDATKPAEGARQATPKPEKTAAPAKPDQQETKATASSAGQYVVQVVALSDAGKAKQMQQAILKTGVSSYTEIVKTARGDVTRVRAGPFATREAAEKAQQKLKSAGFDGKVVPTR